MDKRLDEAPDPVWTWWRKEKYLCLLGVEPLMFTQCPTRYTNC
jgi:hypothetical protein